MLERTLKKFAVGLFRGARVMFHGAVWIIQSCNDDDEDAMVGFFDTRTDEEIAKEKEKKTNAQLLLCVPALFLFLVSVVVWILWALVAFAKLIFGRKH